MSVIWTGRAVTPAHLNPAGWWRWIVKWKSHLVLMNRKKGHLEPFTLSVSLSLSPWFSCYSASLSSGTPNNSYLAHRQASKPPNTHTHIVKRCLRLVYTVMYRHMTAGYILTGVFYKIGRFGGFLPSFHISTRQLAHVIHLNTHTRAEAHK